MTRVVQISDPHFFRFCFNPARLFNKRIIGQINLWWNRQFRLGKGPFQAVLRRVAELKADHVILTGDLVTTALEEEFADVAGLIESELHPTPETFSLIPGNHDRYVGEAERHKFLEKHFRRFLPEGRFPFRKELGGNCVLIGVCAAHPEGLFSANGRLDAESLAALEKLLEETDREGKTVLLACHFPVILPPGYREGFRRMLENKNELAEIVRKHRVKVYLHGHMHERWILPPTDFFPAISVNGGCSSAKTGRPFSRAGYNIIEIKEAKIRIESQGLSRLDKEGRAEFSLDQEREF